MRKAEFCLRLDTVPHAGIDGVMAEVRREGRDHAPHANRGEDWLVRTGGPRVRRRSIGGERRVDEGEAHKGACRGDIQ